MTAIAREASIVDDVLEGLRPMLRHRAAHGLWRLAVAATLTRSEREVYEQADLLERQRQAGRAGVNARAGRIERVAAVLREEDVSWHDPYRSLVVHRLVHWLLPARADAMEEILYRQDSPDWDDLLLDMRHGNEFTDSLADLNGMSHDFEGRGGAAVWRAERKLAREDTILWLRGVHGAAPGRERSGQPPGWTLSLPDEWQPIRWPSLQPLALEWRAHVAAGRVLSLGAGSMILLWPTVAGEHDSKPSLVRGIELITAATGGRSREDLVEVLLLRLAPDQDEVEEETEDSDVDEPEFPPIKLSASRAFNLGLIDKHLRDELLNEARTATRHRMQAVINSMHAARSSTRKELVAAMDAPHRFAALAHAAKIPFTVMASSWTWPITSLAAAVADETNTPAAISWLTQEVIRRHKRRLEESMEEASRAAFDRFSPKSYSESIL
jgi:hypothetical protein